MNLSQLLPVEAVIPHLQVHVKKQALKTMAALASDFTGLPEREIYSVLMEREHAGCTGMGGGVCVPHGRFEQLEKPFALFARLDNSIEFGAADGKEVDLIFLLLTPSEDNTEHLKALALVSKILRDKDLCNKLRASNDAATLHSLLIGVNDKAA